ncbi:MAG: hypothetical protein HY587_08055 [Candidatus Omnitrophica bacterium]|nr:hypothetical protein [Candidatus Omnitrophota bacterium]
MKRMPILSVALLVTGLILGLVSDASALPTFARKYRTSCTTCHLGFFKLNSFGEAFRQNGYTVPGKQDPMLVKEEPVELGAQAWREVFPQAVWPGTIPGTVPVSFYAHQRVFLTEDTKPSLNFKLPHEFKIFTGGNFGEAFSFWAEVDLEAATTGSLGSGMKRVFFQANDLLSLKSWGRLGLLPEDALNLRVGLIDIGVLAQPLNVRRTINKPLPYTYVVADGWDLGDLSSGIEANGVVMGRFKYNVGIVNGTTSGTPSGVFDENNAKDVYYRVAYKYGGLSFDGKDWGGTEGAELKQTDNWADNAITVGQFGYWGTSSTLTGPLFHNQFRRMGVDFRANFRKLDFYGAIINGRDSRPSRTVRTLDTWSWFIEADYVLFPWLQPAIRYEQASFEKAFSRDVDNLIVSLLLWPRANIKLTVEGLITPEDADGASQLLVDLTYAY